jgi:phytoene/squalene synthetase
MSSLKETYINTFSSIDFEKIRDHPNILIAANFWEEERYKAAKTCYKFMRAIDDLIDNYKATGASMSGAEKQKFEEEVEKWLRMIFKGDSGHPLQNELTGTINRFQIPSWPLEAFAKSMIYDIHNDGFATLETFLDYASGASVAPAAIFVHLAGLRNIEGGYSEPLFNVRAAARSCAIFSYLVHIIRDFQKDQLSNLNYFADNLIEKHGLSRGKLADIAKGSEIPHGFRALIGEYYSLADEYRIKTIECINEIWPFLEPRYQLSLEIIFDLYVLVFERIDISGGSFTTTELNPTVEETKQRVFRTITNSRTLSF